MKLSNIANAIDLEHDNGRIIEIGVTTIGLTQRRILQTYSIPLKIDWELSPEIAQLTGWTTAKLNRRGLDHYQADERLLKYGFKNRLLITDMSDEISAIEQQFQSYSPHRLNISILYSLFTGKEATGLEGMLAEFGLTFEGRLHSGADDSRNIARIFLELLQ